MTARPLHFPPPPADRGRALTAEDVAREIFNGAVTAKWVRRYFKPGRDKLGWRTVIWWEAEVRAWKNQHRLEVAP